jgi:hypothetical protein
MSFYSLIYRHAIPSGTQRNYFLIRLGTQINSNKNTQRLVVSWKRKWFHLFSITILDCSYVPFHLRIMMMAFPTIIANDLYAKHSPSRWHAYHQVHL